MQAVSDAKLAGGGAWGVGGARTLVPMVLTTLLPVVFEIV